MRSRITALLIPVLFLALPLYSSAQWTPDPYNGMVMVTDEPGLQDHIMILSLLGGNTIIAWKDNFNLPADKIIYQVLDLRGRALLPEDGVRLIEGDWSHGWGYGGLLPDGEGGCIAVFDDWRDGMRQVYGQRIDAGGNRLWGDNGLPLAVWLEYDLNSMDVTSDSLGNFFVCHGFEVNQNDFYIYAQKFDKDGDCLWGVYGVPVRTCEWFGGFTEVVPDGEGGILIVWEDSRQSGVYDDRLFYFQHLDAEGNPLPPENGIQVQLASENLDYGYDGVTDGEGGGIWAWQSDGPGIDSEICAFRLSGDGRTVWEWYGDLVCTHSFGEMISHPDDGNAWLTVSDDRTGEYLNYLYCFTPEGIPVFGDEGLSCGGSMIPTTGGVITIRSYVTEVGNILRAQLVHNDGSPGWKTNMAQCDSLEFVFYGYRGAPDGFGGAVVAFMDNRQQQVSELDIAAQRVTWNGQVAYTLYKPSFPNPTVESKLTFRNGILSYTLPEAGEVTLELYDILGRRVNILEQGYLQSGSHVVHLSNQNLPSGIYLLHLTTPFTRQTEKIVIVR